jgi:Tol biopolymer transport system component
MGDALKCSSCGADLAPDNMAQGICAACLLKLGLSSTNIPEPELPPTPAVASSNPAPKRRHPWIGISIAAALILVVALVSWFLVRPSRPQAIQVLRFSVESADPGSEFAISPDGRKLVFVSQRERGQSSLTLRSLDAFVEQGLPGTEGGRFPFWSPDSQSIGFFSRDKLRKFDLGTGATETLADARTGRDGTWSSAGIIVFARTAEGGGLFRLSAHGGAPEPATRIDHSTGAIAHRWPHFLPDGRHFLFTSISRNADNDAIFVASLDTGAIARVQNVRSPAWYAQESLLYVRSGILMASPFDFRRQRLSGSPRSIRFAEHVNFFSASEANVLAYRSREDDQLGPLAVFDRSGKIVKVFDDLSEATQFSIAPDGRNIALSKRGDIWIMAVDRGVTSRFTFSQADNSSPIWAPDEAHLAFISTRNGARGVYQKKVNGAENEEGLLTTPDVESLDSWSTDGRFLAFTSRDAQGKSRLAVLTLGERKPIAIPSSFNLREGQFSPDGRWLAYVSDESGKDEIYIQTFPGSESKWQVSANGGTSPRWRRDGRGLFFISPEKELMTVALGNDGPRLTFNVPTPLFRAPNGTYDITADDRFLMRVREVEKPPSPINIVVNWSAELGR